MTLCTGSERLSIDSDDVLGHQAGLRRRGRLRRGFSAGRGEINGVDQWANIRAILGKTIHGNAQESPEFRL